MNAGPDFDALYRAEFEQVRRAVFLLCGDAQLAEDATQEAFARALARWRRLRTHQVPGGWITTTAMNVARRQLRRRHEPITVEPTHPDGADAVTVRAAIAALPPRQQEAVALHYLLDMPVAEVATAMEIDAGTVKTHLSRAREALARTLTGTEHDPSEEYTRE
jgi:RNA polymerase sigma-70 factor (ECF subfamily)